MKASAKDLFTEGKKNEFAFKIGEFFILSFEYFIISDPCVKCLFNVCLELFVLHILFIYIICDATHGNILRAETICRQHASPPLISPMILLRMSD